MRQLPETHTVEMSYLNLSGPDKHGLFPCDHVFLYSSRIQTDKAFEMLRLGTFDTDSQDQWVHLLWHTFELIYSRELDAGTCFQQQIIMRTLSESLLPHCFSNRYCWQKCAKFKLLSTGKVQMTAVSLVVRTWMAMQSLQLCSVCCSGSKQGVPSNSVVLSREEWGQKWIHCI